MGDYVERKCVIELLRLYRAFPALWNINHEDYNNYFKKHQHYEFLLEKYRETYPDAYMRELKKKITSLHRGYKAEDIKNLNGMEKNTFLNDNMTVTSPTADIYQILSNNNIEIEEIEIKPDLDYLTEKAAAFYPTSSDVKCETEQMEIKPEIYQRANSVSNCTQGFLSKEITQTKLKYDSIHQPIVNHEQTQDTFHTLFSMWAEKFTNIDAFQRVFAEKLISDILLHAELGLLTINTSITNVSPYGDNVPIAKKKITK